MFLLIYPLQLPIQNALYHTPADHHNVSAILYLDPGLFRNDMAGFMQINRNGRDDISIGCIINSYPSAVIVVGILDNTFLDRKLFPDSLFGTDMIHPHRQGIFTLRITL